MKVKVSLMIGEQQVKEDVLEIEDMKLEQLTEEEIQGVIEIKIRNWANQWISVPWEVVNES